MPLKPTLKYPIAKLPIIEKNVIKILEIFAATDPDPVFNKMLPPKSKFPSVRHLATSLILSESEVSACALY